MKKQKVRELVCSLNEKGQKVWTTVEKEMEQHGTGTATGAVVAGGAALVGGVAAGFVGLNLLGVACAGLAVGAGTGYLVSKRSTNNQLVDSLFPAPEKELPEYMKM
jgi:hypothetical protein